MTVRSYSKTALPVLHLIVVFPAFKACTVPLLSTAATSPDEEDHRHALAVLTTSTSLVVSTTIFVLAFSSFGTYTLHLIFLPVRVTQTIVVFPVFLAFTTPFEVTVAIFLFPEYHFLAFEFLTFKVNFFFLDKVSFSLLNPTTTTLHLYVFFFVFALI